MEEPVLSEQGKAWHGSMGAWEHGNTNYTKSLVVRLQARKNKALGRDWRRMQESDPRAGPITLAILAGAYITE